MALFKSLTRILMPENWVTAISRYVPLRHRYMLTRGNRLRLRYSLPSAVAGVVLAVTLMAHTDAASLFQYSGQSHYRLASAAAIYGPEQELSVNQKRLNRYASAAEKETGSSDGLILASFAPEIDPTPQPKEQTLTIGKGDTLAGVLQRAGVSAGDAFNAVKAMEEYYDPRHIRPGQEVHVRFEPTDEDDLDFTEMRMDIDMLKSVSLKRTPDDGFESALHEKDVETRVYAKKAEIEVSLYGSAQKAGIPASVVAQAIRALSWDIDFQRDIRRGDTVELMYEQTETADGVKVKTGDIIYARLNINGHDMPIYRYETPDGDVDYYTADGASVRKALLKTPVDGARISSGFGVREHPVLGYTKMHKGVDFAAPRGTPVYAAGDGTIERASRWSTYGNYVRIRHNSSIKTAYAHLNGFGKGITAGKRVKQGDIIGYIGTTGRSTGPHLHYEVMLNGTQVNPKSVKLPQGEVLKGKQLAAFKDYIRKIDRQYVALSGGNKVASRQTASSSTLR